MSTYLHNTCKQLGDFFPTIFTDVMYFFLLLAISTPSSQIIQFSYKVIDTLSRKVKLHYFPSV